MNEGQFHKRVKEILQANRGPNNSPDKEFHEALSNQVKGRSKKDWDDEVAAQVIREFEWGTGTQPKSVEPTESEIKSAFTEFLKVRSYTFTPIPEDTRKTPDNYIEGDGHKYICEIKSPVLRFDVEAQLYKFKTSHRKILDFIHTAVKQFNSLDSSHSLPRVLVFTSAGVQLNWKSFTDAIQGGVVDRKGVGMPDFSKTPVYTSTLPILGDIDVYVWLQVSGTRDKFYQASYFLNENSAHIQECRTLVNNLAKTKLSSLDNLYSLNLKHS